ncbi:DUF7283 family protein [Halobacterium jilantaiense]|uniref:Uncharacterized protein n=1 Tax=Halobacterium jilantaiense TaxID=355548 RepID=A0A1I0NZJ0_9EURY|nr:hypothetical protein [Halobacterium jilantaiense]SEW07250.1 hypothetical protein SAMN04487945_1272 [Halobacterium jilantaiense]
MFDTPADTPPVLVALSLVSTALAGVAFAASPTPPPRAAPLAGTVDAVAAADTAGVETREVAAEALRLTPNEVAVRSDAGTAHAQFAYGLVVPVREDTRLWAVLHGTPPDDRFADPSALRSAADDATAREHRWRDDPARLTVRRVTWRGVDVTLVGA